MTILSIKELPGKRAHKSKVQLQGGVDLCLYNKEIRRLGLVEDGEISEAMYQEILATILIPRAKRRAMHLLEKQDRTKANLTRKLKESGYPDEAVDEAVAYVESYHYIDDDRYARNYVRYHQEGKSKRKIFEDLFKKGIAKDTINHAIEEEYFASEDDMILELIEKKHYDVETADIKEKAKMYRFLLGRGFRSNDIDRILSKR
ncbi:MAG: recombination regulator RecX [Lachnospiraceae bacterium]|nr:recombination regulator RecX [Lachnospiraceae bacterium]